MASLGYAFLWLLLVIIINSVQSGVNGSVLGTGGVQPFIRLPDPRCPLNLTVSQIDGFEALMKGAFIPKEPCLFTIIIANNTNLLIDCDLIDPTFTILKELRMSNNSKFTTFCMRDAPVSLQVLDLRNNSLSTVVLPQPGKHSINQLLLSGNPLSSLDFCVITSVWDNSGTVSSINFDKCDCDVAWLAHLTDRDKQYIPEPGEDYCNSWCQINRNTTQLAMDVTKSDFYCPAGGPACPFHCNCSADTLLCSSGPPVNNQSVILDGIFFPFLTRIPAFSLQNITTKSVGDIKVRLNNFSLLVAIEDNAFSTVSGMSVIRLVVTSNPLLETLAAAVLPPSLKGLTAVYNQRLSSVSVAATVIVTLNLSHNSIDTLLLAATLAKLETLDLSFNRVRSVNRAMFRNAPALRRILLNDNLLTTLALCDVIPFFDNAAALFKTIALQGNFFVCNCSLYFLRNYQSVIDGNGDICTAPEYARNHTQRNSIENFDSICLNPLASGHNCVSECGKQDVEATGPICGCGYCSSGLMCTRSGVCSLDATNALPDPQKHCSSYLLCARGANCTTGDKNTVSCMCSQPFSGVTCEETEIDCTDTGICPLAQTCRMNPLTRQTRCIASDYTIQLKYGFPPRACGTCSADESCNQGLCSCNDGFILRAGVCQKAWTPCKTHLDCGFMSATDAICVSSDVIRSKIKSAADINDPKDSYCVCRSIDYIDPISGLCNQDFLFAAAVGPMAASSDEKATPTDSSVILFSCIGVVCVAMAAVGLVKYMQRTGVVTATREKLKGPIHNTLPKQKQQVQKAAPVRKGESVTTLTRPNSELELRSLQGGAALGAKWSFTSTNQGENVGIFRERAPQFRWLDPDMLGFTPVKPVLTTGLIVPKVTISSASESLFVSQDQTQDFLYVQRGRTNSL